MTRLRIVGMLAAGAAPLVGVVALAQSGLPPMHVEVAVPSWILGLVLAGMLALFAVAWRQLGEKIDRGFAQLHARIGELKADHGEEIKGLRARSHELAGHVAAIDAKVTMHLDEKGA